MEITQGTCNYQFPVFCPSFHTQKQHNISETGYIRVLS